MMNYVETMTDYNLWININAETVFRLLNYFKIIFTIVLYMCVLTDEGEEQRTAVKKLKTISLVNVIYLVQ